MKLKKSDFLIMYESEGVYRIKVREPFFWIFKRWVYLTCQEAENADETRMDFKSFKAATDFIENIAE